MESSFPAFYVPPMTLHRFVSESGLNEIEVPDLQIQIPFEQQTFPADALEAYTTTQTCDDECRRHKYYHLICEFEQRRAAVEIENCKRKILELEAFIQGRNFEEPNPVDLPRPTLPYRDFTSMEILISDYEDLLEGKRFIIKTNTGFNHFTRWYVFRVPSGLLYFICKRYTNNTFTYSVKQAGYTICEPNVYFVHSENRAI